jgi:hypothetical protein
LRRRDAALTGAQFVIARVHGFVSWPVRARISTRSRARPRRSRTSEEAADAIVTATRRR